MQRIPDEILECAVYLYGSKDDANRGERFGGSGFFLAVPGVDVEPIVPASFRDELTIVLSEVGLVPSNACLNPDEVLSPGQAEELDRIARVYPNLHDDEIVKANLDEWLR